MYHLPAYLALSRLVLARRVVVVAPRSLEGPRQLLRAGAREILIIGADLPPEEGIQVRPDLGTSLPLRDGSVDVVCAIESFGTMPNRRRRELLREAHRVVRPDGLFAAWIEQPDGDVFGERLRGATTVDFWSLEDELSVIFQHVYMLAQMPWRGFSLAPVLDEDESTGGDEPRIRLEENLLADPPSASHYLAVAGKSPLPATVSRECLLVPLELESISGRASEVDDLADELDRLREELSIRAAKAAAAQRRVQELEGQLQSVQVDRHSEDDARVDAAEQALADVREQLATTRGTLEDKTVELQAAQQLVSSLEGQMAQGAGSDELERQLAAARSTNEALEVRVAQLESALEDAEASRAQLDEHRREADEVAQALERSKAERQQLELDLAEANARVEALDVQLDAAKKQAQSGADVEKRAASDVEKLESELDAAQAELAKRGEALAERDAEVKALSERVRAQDTDLQILTRTLKDHEVALSRLEAQDGERREQLEVARNEASQLRGRAEATESERDELRRQVDVVLAEREGARNLAARVEAELEVARRRLKEQEEQLSSKIEEASRTSTEAEVMRRRLVDQDVQLAETRSRAEKLTAQAEQGRMLADVALDRDRLREELGQRRQQVQKLEERLWQARDVLQKEKIEAVRIGGELERAKEQAERSRAAERERAQEVEQLGRSLREAEVARAELEVSLRMRAERIEQLSAETSALEGRSEDLDQLREKLEERGNQVAELSGALEQARLREKQANDLARRRERELDDGGRRITEMQRISDEQAKLAAELSGELEVKEVQIEELAAQVSNLQRQLQDQRNQIAMRERDKAEVSRRLEDAAAEQRSLRKQLRQREQELDDLSRSQENSAAEMMSLRRELESSAVAAEREGREGDDDWPDEARNEVRRLRAQVESLERQMASGVDAETAESERVARLRREAEVRATEQEFILSRLDAAEQQIWEMTDASDRNAARFAASLAQLEKQKEKVDQLVDELEVTRSLLSSEQARALEQERLLASERAKLARAGIDVSGFPRRVPSEDVDRLFEDMESPAGGGNLVDLTQRQQKSESGPAVPETGAPSPVDDRGGSSGLGTGSMRRSSENATQRARMVIEVDEGEDEWPEEGAVAAEDAPERDG